MKQLIIFAMLLCILATSGLAATVTTRVSGIAPGSHYHIFTYSLNDTTPTVVNQVLPNDLIQINYPNPKDPHNPLTLTYFFKNQVDNWWDYTVFQEYNDIIINISEREPIDLYGDGQVELYMEFSNLTDMRYGTFTFYNALAAQPPANTTNVTENATATNTTPAANETLVGNDRDAHGCIPSAGYSWCEAQQKCLRPWEEACNTTMTNTNTSNTTVPAVPPVPLAAESSPFPWGTVITIVIVIVACGFYVYLMTDKGEQEDDEKPKKKRKEKKDDDE